MTPPATDPRSDEEVMDDLFEVLRDDAPPAPEALAEKTMRKVEASITSRDLVDLVTVVFLVRFCAPLIDLIAALFGHTPADPNRRDDDE